MHPLENNKRLKTLLFYCLFYFITDKNYRKHNGYLTDLQQYRAVLVLLAPVAYIGAAIARTIKKIR